eukprot:178458-Chlamydomonas_euryale.AAC.4
MCPWGYGGASPAWCPQMCASCGACMPRPKQGAPHYSNPNSSCMHGTHLSTHPRVYPVLHDTFTDWHLRLVAPKA